MPPYATPGIKIMLDKERTMRLDLNGMIAFRDLTGKSLLLGFDINNMKEEDIRAFLWACLIHEESALTVEQVGNMIHIGNMTEVMDKMMEAFKEAMPEPKGDDPLVKKRRRG